VTANGSTGHSQIYGTPTEHGNKLKTISEFTQLGHTAIVSFASPFTSFVVSAFLATTNSGKFKTLSKLN